MKEINLIKDNWTIKDYNEFKKYLLTNQDIKYKEFTKNIIVDNTLIGIRTPKLKQIAKDICKGNYESFLKLSKDDTYEEKLVYGLIVGNIKEYDTKYIDIYKNKINNWALCDIFCSNFKAIKKHKKEYLCYIKDNITSNNLWIRRMCFVLLLDYYIEKDYLEVIFRMCDTYITNDYYVEMSIAWLISICYIKYKDETIKYLNNNKLNDFTYNKSIQKIIESKRVSNEEKNILRTMKRGKNENNNS